MKVKTISRAEEDYTRERSQDLAKVHRNLDPQLHQMQRAHEYVRAVNAAKLDKARSWPPWPLPAAPEKKRPDRKSVV